MRFVFTPAVFVAFSSIVLSSCDTHSGGQQGPKSAGNTLADVQNSAGTGSQAADLHLAKIYFKGDGVAKDPAEGLRLLRRAANGSDVSSRRLANFKLGKLNQDGIPGHLTPNRIAALGYFQKSAADEYEPANSRLAELARYPDVIVELNRSEFTGRPQGTEPARLARGKVLFAAGDYAAAFPIFLYHARNGSIEAQWVTSLMYLKGLGVIADETRYKGWSYIAAQNGEPSAQLALGVEFRLGKMVPASDAEAEIWLTRAANQDDAQAHRILGVIALDPHDQGRRRDAISAIRHYEAAAAAGYARANLILGDIYFEGYGVPRDRDKARAKYMAAADAGIPEAKSNLLKDFNIAYEGKPASPAPTAPRTAAYPPSRTVTSPLTGERPSLVELYKVLSPSVIQIVAIDIKAGPDGDISQGSGVIIRPDLILTNCHVLEGSNRFGTQLNKKILTFKPAGGDTKRDLCLLRSSQTLKHVGRSRKFDSLKVGEKVFAIGSPNGLENTLTEGIISGLRRSEGIRYIQTSTPISPGSSGGGLFDEDGNLIGITTFKLDGDNLNFAVAIDESESIIARVK